MKLLTKCSVKKSIEKYVFLDQWSSRSELSHPRVNETYFRVNGVFGVNQIFTVQLYTEKTLKFFKFIF